MTHNNNIPYQHRGFILIADDDLDDQELLGSAFHTIDNLLHLEFMHNGNKLILYLETLADEELPSLIILDYNMPELNGVDILKILRTKERYKAIPKIVWSTSSSSLFRNLSLELGATDYIVKPSDFASFGRIAARLLGMIAVRPLAPKGERE